MGVLLLSISTTQLISIVLVLILVFLGFRIIEMNWSYKISKPHLWEEAVSKGSISGKLKKIERFYRDKVRFYNFWFQVERLKKDGVAGSFAEVGVYRGETARMIHAMDPSRVFYLFDTFQGFDERDLQFENRESESLKSVDFTDATMDDVRSIVEGNENIKVIKGYFPDSVMNLPDQRYALAHLDADLYKPTLEGLKYFYPRLSPGGVIVVHDYNHNWEGVRKALDEFKATIPEQLIEVTDWQGSAMIIKNS